MARWTTAPTAATERLLARRLAAPGGRAVRRGARRRGDRPGRAWDAWRAEREALYREHPRRRSCRPSARLRRPPLAVRRPAAVRGRRRARAAGRVRARRVPFGALTLPNSGAEALAFDRVGRVTLPLPGGDGALALFWMRGYTGGLFLPFRDATSGDETYGAGRYVLDTGKGADLGGDPAAGTLVVDLNFAFQPSCAFDPKWACPLAPPENRLPARIEAGERLR